MPAPHALYSKMLAERTASRNVLVLFYFIDVRAARFVMPPTAFALGWSCGALKDVNNFVFILIFVCRY
jgi:hypothetical protein